MSFTVGFPVSVSENCRFSAGQGLKRPWSSVLMLSPWTMAILAFFPEVSLYSSIVMFYVDDLQSKCC